MKLIYIFVTNILKTFWNYSALVSFYDFQIKGLGNCKYDAACSLISNIILLCFWAPLWIHCLIHKIIIDTIMKFELEWSIGTVIFLCVIVYFTFMSLIVCYLFIREFIINIKIGIILLFSIDTKDIRFTEDIVFTKDKVIMNGKKEMKLISDTEE